MNLPIDIPTTNAQQQSFASTAQGLVIPWATEGVYALARKVFNLDNLKTYTPVEAKKKGTLGLPIFMPLTLGEDKGGGYWYYLANGFKNEVPILNIDCCVVEINATKEIVKSMPSGGNIKGTVKEYINQGDYQMRIMGVFASTDGTYPQDQVDILRDYINAPIQIPILHDLLYALGIYQIVIESWALPARPGFENLQAFELNCVSDYEFQYKIENK